uniref:Receptor ligand binding region domain-containing protein n=1 Tax=Gopherus agassizii TaxID=38772 RepID=A0A452GTH2_9SAUR
MPTSPAPLLLLIVGFARLSLQVLSSLRMGEAAQGVRVRVQRGRARAWLPGVPPTHSLPAVCQILPKGVVSVLGPASSPASAATVSHICGEKEIPHVKVGPEETPRLQYLRFASVSLYPSNEDLSLALARILQSFNSPSASLLCAKAECLLRLEELVRQFLISKETLSIRMLDDAHDPTPLLKEIRDDKISTIIVDANASLSYLVLKKVLAWALLGEAHSARAQLGALCPPARPRPSP